MPIRLTIDAMPVLVGGGGISNYVNPLVQHLLEIEDSDICATLHWRVRGRKKRERARQLIRHGEHQEAINVCTSIPDRVLSACWACNLPFLASMSLPATDVYLATTEMLPRNARFSRLAIVHDVTPAMIPEYFVESRERYVERVAAYCRHCDGVICVSATTARNLARECGVGEEKTTVIYPGLPDPMTAAAGDDSVLAGLGVRHPFMVYVGALSGNKNVDGLLRAFGRFARIERDWQLVLVGKDFMGREYWERIVAEENVKGRVVFTGWMGDERWALLRQARLLVHVSWYEGFPVPLLEAFSVGLPALVSDCGPYPEVLPYEDQRVNPGIPSVIADRMLEFARSESLRLDWVRNMRREARKYDWRTSADMLRSVIVSQCAR